MRRKRGAPVLESGNTLEANGWGEVPLQETPFGPLAVLIAGVLDDIAGGENVYLSIGTTRLRDSFLINVVENGIPDREAFLTLDGLGEAATLLLGS